MSDPLTEVNKLASTVSKTIDDNFESSEERQKALSARHRLDATTDAWLPKNIRPIILIFLMSMLFAMLILRGYTILRIDAELYETVKYLSLAAFSFYFGGRSWEKMVTQREEKRTKADVIKAKAAAVELHRDGKEKRRRERRHKE